MATINTEHYIRLLLLSAQAATPVLRETLINFVKQTSNKTLGDFLLTFQGLFKTLKAKCILSESEHNKLLQGSAVDINEWDTSLLCFVLLNCCTLQGKLNEFKCILQKEAKINNDLDTFVRLNKATIDTFKGNGISEEQYNIVYPDNGVPTDIELWDMDLITFILINVCTGKVQKCVQEFRRILQTELEIKISSLNLTNFLKSYEDQLRSAKAQGKLDESQFDDLYPRSGLIADIYKWDTNTLRIVVLNCTSSLSNQAVHATKKLRELRNKCLAHRNKPEMTNLEYINKSKDLIDAIDAIIINEKLPIKSESDKMIEELVDKPIEVKTALDILKNYYMKETTENLLIWEKLESIEPKLDIIQDKVQEIINEMNDLKSRLPDAEYSHQTEIRCVDILLVIKSVTELGRRTAEEIIQNAMSNAGDTSSEKMREAVLGVIKEIVIDGRTIVEIKRGSIIISIKCTSLKALHGLLKCVSNEDMKYQLKLLSSAVSEIVEESIDITICMSEISVINACEDVIQTLSEYVSNTSALRMTMRADTVEDLQMMVEDFKGESVKSQLQSLSEGLSTYLGEDITVDVVVPNIDARAITTVTNTENMESKIKTSQDSIAKLIIDTTPAEVLQQNVSKQKTNTIGQMNVTEIPQQHEDICAEEVEDTRSESRISVSKIPQQHENTCAEEVEDTRGGSRISESHMMVGMLEEALADVCMDDKYISNDKVSEIPKKRTKICEEENEDTQEIYKTTKVQKITRGDIHFESRMMVGMLEEALADVCMDDKYISNDKVSEIPKKRTKICEEENEDTQEIYKTTKVQKITRGDIHFDYLGRGGYSLQKIGLSKNEQTEQLELYQYKAKKETMKWRRSLTDGYRTFLKGKSVEKDKRFHNMNLNFTSVSRDGTVVGDCCKLSDILRGGCKTSVVDTSLPLVGVPITLLAIMQDWVDSQDMSTDEMNGQQKFMNTFDLLLITDNNRDVHNMTIIGKRLVILVHHFEIDLHTQIYSSYRDSRAYTDFDMKMKQFNLSTTALLTLTSVKPSYDGYIYMSQAYNPNQVILQEMPTMSTQSYKLYCDTGRIEMIVFLNKRINQRDLLLMKSKEVRIVRFHNCEMSCFKDNDASSNISPHSYENIVNIVLSNMMVMTDITYILRLTNLVEMTIAGNIKGSLSNLTTLSGLEIKLTSLVMEDILLNEESKTQSMKLFTHLTSLIKLKLSNIRNVNNEGIDFPIMNNLTSLQIENIMLDKKSTTLLIKSLTNLISLNELTLKCMHDVKKGGLEFPVMNKLISLQIDTIKLDKSSTTVLMKSLANLTSLTELRFKSLSDVKNGRVEFPVMNKLTFLLIDSMTLDETSTTVLMKSLANLTSLTELRLIYLRDVKNGRIEFPVMNKLSSLEIAYVTLDETSTTVLMKSLANLTSLTELRLRYLRDVKNGRIEFPVMNKLSSLKIAYVTLDETSTTVLMKSLANLHSLIELRLKRLRDVMNGRFDFPVMKKLTSLQISYLRLDEKSTTVLMKSLANLTCLTELRLTYLWDVDKGGLEFPVMNKLNSLLMENISLDKKSRTVLMKSLANLTSLTELTIQHMRGVEEGGIEFPVMDKLALLVMEGIRLNEKCTAILMKSLDNLTCLTKFTLNGVEKI